ncbi:MAG: hypothetical protein AB8G05_12950 [Oligoflexales bacterium]
MGQIGHDRANVGRKKVTSIAGVGAAIGLVIFGAWDFSLTEPQKQCLRDVKTTSSVQKIKEYLLKIDQTGSEIEDMLK